MQLLFNHYKKVFLIQPKENEINETMKGRKEYFENKIEKFK